MKYIVKKASMSMLTGAAYMVGSWVAKHLLEKGNEEVNKRLKKQKENCSA